MTHTELIWQGVTAIVTILTIVAAYLKTRTNNQINHQDTSQKLEDTSQKIDTVQTTVNGQTEALHNRVNQLTALLSENNIAIPAENPTQGG